MASSCLPKLCRILFIAACVMATPANAQIILPLSAYHLGSVAAGDFNHDGILDLGVVSPCINFHNCTRRSYVTFYQGDGTGHFIQTTSVYLGATITGTATFADFYGNGSLQLVVPTAYALAIVESGKLAWYQLLGGGYTAVRFADINHDGKLDMLFSAWGGFCVTLGDGAGNYTGFKCYSGGGVDLVIGDFNGDGNVDAATTNSSVISVYLGNGNGTFQPAIQTLGPYDSLAAADFNRDGKLDLVAGTHETSNITILLGNGDGTFSPLPPANTGQYHSTAVVAGDFNSDGKPDVAVANGCWTKGWPCHSPGSVSVFLGNGDGTLQPPVSYASGGHVLPARYAEHDFRLISADLDHNGSLDLMAMNQIPVNPKGCRNGRGCNSTLGILLGNGDGTFQSAPVNSHFVTATSSTSTPNPSIYGQAVNFTATVDSEGPVAPTGNVLIKLGRTLGQGALSGGVTHITVSNVPAGATKLDIVYSGDNAHLKSTFPYVQTVEPAATTTTIISSANPSVQGETVKFIAAVRSAYAFPKGTVTFTTSNGETATVPLASGIAKFHTKTLPVGSTTITATYNPEPNKDGSTNFTSTSTSIVQVVE